MSDPADSLSGRADNVWPGRQCLTWHTTSLTQFSIDEVIRPSATHEITRRASIHNEPFKLHASCHQRLLQYWKMIDPIYGGRIFPGVQLLWLWLHQGMSSERT